MYIYDVLLLGMMKIELTLFVIDLQCSTVGASRMGGQKPLYIFENLHRPGEQKNTIWRSKSI